MKREIRNFKIRPFTADDALNFTSIVERNEYRLPVSMKGWAVMDVGAHIGCFALASYLRGADRIFSYEVEEGNYDALVANATMMAPHVKPLRLAVWRSDVEAGGGKLSYVPSENERRTGGGNVLMTNTGVPSSQEVDFIAFDKAVDIITAFGAKRIDLVKLDCEGSEWPILLTSKRLNLVERLFGEFHEIGGPRMQLIRESHGSHPKQIPHSARVANEEGSFYEAYTQEVLGDLLADKGFHVKIEPAEDHGWIGHFWAMRSEDEFEAIDS